MQYKNYEIVYNINQFMFNQSIEAFEALYLFKEHFGSLLDSSIVAIYLNASNITIVRKTFAHDDDIYVDHETTYLKKDISLDLIEVADEASEVPQLYLSVKNLSTELSRVKYEQDYETICYLIKHALSCLSITVLRELEIFGVNTLAYQLYDAYDKVKNTKKILLVSKLNYEQTTNYLVNCLLDISKISKEKILEESLLKIRPYFQTLAPTFHTEPSLLSMWQQIGYCLTIGDQKRIEGIMIENCQSIYNNLTHNEKLALNLSQIKVEDLDIDIDYPLVDFKDLVYEDGIEDIKQYCLNAAHQDWLSFNRSTHYLEKI